MNIKCFFKRHDYFVVQKFGHISRKIGCRRCGRRWGMNDECQAFIEWDGTFDELYTTLGYKLRE